MICWWQRGILSRNPLLFYQHHKVYGDRPNTLPLIEPGKALRITPGGLDGIDESMSIDGCLHSISGLPKLRGRQCARSLAAYFNMPVGSFRCGCLTDLSKAVRRVARISRLHHHLRGHRRPYTIYGYKGKQVPSQIHCRDVARLFLEFYKFPKVAEVFNLARRAAEQYVDSRNH